MHRDPRGGLGHLGGADRVADVLAVQVHAGPSSRRSKSAAAERQRGAVVEVDAGPQGGQRHAAVHRPRVEVGEVERGGDRARDGALPRPRGAVDSDHHASDEYRVGRSRPGTPRRSTSSLAKRRCSSSADEGRVIAIHLPAGEQLQEHQVHERAWLVVVSGEVEIRPPAPHRSAAGSACWRASPQTNATRSRRPRTRVCCWCWRHGPARATRRRERRLSDG